MTRRARKGGFERWVEAFARLPWQVSAILAPIAWIGFHLLAQLEPPPAKAIDQLGPSVGVMIFRQAGMIMQFLAPAILLTAALASWLSQRRRMKLLGNVEASDSGARLRDLSWREFEQIVGAHFEREGYSVSFTAEGADGGVDLRARKGAETYLVQCKQWRGTQVGVRVVRELFGLISAHGAAGGFVVSIGSFTRDARAFAEGRNIQLVDARALLRKSGPAGRVVQAEASAADASPACPRCGATMVRRVARQGQKAGRAFYGCSTYPTCRGTVEAG